MASYSAGGYVDNLENITTLSTAMARVRVLRAENWLDLRTRALLVEALTYNVQTRLFTNMIVGLEFFAGGAAFSSAQITTLQLDIYSGPNGIAVIVLQIICLLFIIWFIFGGICKLFKEKLNYFKVQFI